MTEFEQKAAELETELKTAKDEAKVARDEAKAAKENAEKLAGELAEKARELKTAQDNIDALDASVKSQDAAIKALQKKNQEAPKSFKTAMREALEGVKEKISNYMQKAEGNMTVEVKLATTDYTPQAGAQAWGNMLDPVVAAVPYLQNTFLVAFGTRPIAGSRIAWREATTTKNVGYVTELLENKNKSTVVFNEKYRLPAKIATYMEISSEAEMWFEELVNFCTTEGQRLIEQDADDKIWAGAGVDSTKPREVYGIKGQATAFAALAKYDNANVADIISDAVAQVNKAGYNANIAIVSYATEQSLKGIKDGNGNYMYDAVNKMLGQVRVLPSRQLTDEEILVADNSCADVYLGATYELEFSRKAETDSWRVDFRRLVQTVVKTPAKKGIVYVAKIATALTSISKASA